VLRANRWYTGEEDDEGRRDITWYSVWGLAMTPEEWTNPTVRCIAALIDGKFCTESCESVLLLFNASHEPVSFTLPQDPIAEGDWRVRIDTSDDACLAFHRHVTAVDKFEMLAHSMAVLTQPAKGKLDAAAP
jgi:glycogen operon protein